MFDLLQVAPDIITQVADSTEIFSDPMRAILDSISVKTGQTALNTARDTVDWEIIGITKRDYYLAIAAIIIAIISLIVDIFTTIYQHKSSSNSRLMSAKYTREVQGRVILDMILSLFKNSIQVISIKFKLAGKAFFSYPSEKHMRRLLLRNNLELDALLPGDKSFSEYHHIREAIENFNNDCEIVTEHLKSATIDDDTKKSELDNLVMTMGQIALDLASLYHTIGEMNNICQYITLSLNRRDTFVSRVDGTLETYDDPPGLHSVLDEMAVFRYLLTENEDRSIEEKVNDMIINLYKHYYAREIIMIPIR